MNRRRRISSTKPLKFPHSFSKQTFVFDVMFDYFYRVRLNFDRDLSRIKDKVELSVPFIENNISTALKSVFGESGAGIPFNVVKVTEETDFLDLIIATNLTFAKKLRAAITLKSQFQSVPSFYEVLNESDTLIELH